MGELLAIISLSLEPDFIIVGYGFIMLTIGAYQRYILFMVLLCRNSPSRFVIKNGPKKKRTSKYGNIKPEFIIFAYNKSVHGFNEWGYLCVWLCPST